jgi:hypothetical protein
MAGLAEIIATRQSQLYRLCTVDPLLSASFPLNFVLYSARTFHLSFKFNPVTVTSKTGQIISLLNQSYGRTFQFFEAFLNMYPIWDK